LTLPALVALPTGCVMVTRHAAREINRENAETSLRRILPVGTGEGRIRTVMDERGYDCVEIAPVETDAFRLSCVVRRPRRNFGTFLAGGNWRIEFLGKASGMTRLHAYSKRARNAPARSAGD
jgi:hypothetical protein